MSDKSVAEKAHVKAGTSVSVLNEVPGVVESLGLPDYVSYVEPEAADLIFLFVRDRQQLDTLMRPAVAQLRPAAAIWVFYRKGSSEAGLDMSRNDVWIIADEQGLRPLGLVSIDDTWSAFRLKKGAE